MGQVRVYYYGGEPKHETDFSRRFYHGESAYCTKCGEPLSLPMPGFEDKSLLDSLYCVGCRPEETKQGVLRLERRL